MTIQEEISYLANAMSDEQRNGMFLANAGFVSDAQRKAVMAKFRDGEGGGGKSPYGDADIAMEHHRDYWYRDYVDKEGELHSHLEDIDRAIHDSNIDLKSSTQLSYREFVSSMNNLPACGYDKEVWYGRYKELANRESVEEEITERALYLANKELTDEQRKAIFAKMGVGGSGGGGTQVYTRASSASGSSKRIAGTTTARTVSTTSNGTSGGGSHYTGAGDRTSSWVTKLSPEQMKEEYKNDPDRLKAAIEEQLHWGAYDGIEVNGHKPSVMDIINGGIAPNYVQEGRTLTDAEVARLQRGSVDGYEARALNPSGQDFDSAPGFSWDEWVGIKEGKKPSWLDVGGGSGSSMGSASSPSDQAKQDVSGGGSSSTSGGASASGTASLPDAIDNLPDAGGSGASDGGAGDGGSSAPNYLQEFLDALALAHF